VICLLRSFFRRLLSAAAKEEHQVQYAEMLDTGFRILDILVMRGDT